MWRWLVVLAACGGGNATRDAAVGDDGCDYHPNAATQQIMATAITAEIRRVTGW